MADEPTTWTPGDEAEEQRDHAMECAAGLRELADWIDAHPDVLSSSDLSGVNYLLCRLDKDKFLETARALGPNVEQKNDGTFFHVIRHFGPVQVQLYIDPKYLGSPRTAVREVTEWQLDDDVRNALSEAAA